MAHNNQPNKRALHEAVLSASGDSLYVWGGAQLGLPQVHGNEDKRRITSNIQHFTPATGQWITRGTTGTPPLGVGAYCCAAINDLLYYFGGDCGHDDCYHNSITQLDTVSFQWTELEPTDANRPVMRRGYGGMISFEHDGVHHLLIIGGLGSKPAVQIPHYKYIKLLFEAWRTNEHSLYNISSRKWSNPFIVGQCIPPASYFIIEKINNTRAVLFGGKETDDAKTNFSNNIYILEISISTVFWQCIKKPEAIDQWPVSRMHHAGAIIITGSDCPMLVISGGGDKNKYTLDDCWIFNITQHSWIKLDVLHSVSKRRNHSLSVFIMSPHCVWIISIGGRVDDEYIANPDIAMLTELVTNSKGEWTVGDILDTNGMISKEYKKKYEQQLQTGRRIWLEEYQKPRKGETADIEHTVQALMKSLKEKEREAQVFRQQMEQKEREKAEKDQEIRRYRHQLQEKAREEAQREERYHNGLQEKDRELQEKEKEEAKKEKRHHQQLLQEKVRIEALKNEEIQQYRYQLQEKEQEIQTYCNLLQEKEREKAEMEQRYYWQLQENERKDSLKDEEMQRYHYQKEEIQKYIYQLQEKERKEAQQDQVIQGYRQQLQEKTAKQQEIQKYCEKLKEQAEKEIRLHQQLQEKEAIKEKEIQRYCQELQEKGKKEAEKEHIYHHQLLGEQRLKEKYFQQLQQKDKELAEKEEKIQMYHHQLQEKEREAQEKQRVICQQLEQKEREETEKDQEIRRYHHQLQEKDKEETEREEKYHNQLQEKDMELQEKDRELQEKDRELQEKYKEQAEREERYYNQLQEKDRKLQEKDRELKEKAREEAERKQRYYNKLQDKEKEKAEIEQKYYWQLQENERKDSVKNEEMQRYIQLLQEKEQEYDQHLQEKAKEIQHYHYQLQKKEQEIQKYTYQLKEKERKETQQDQVIQRYRQQLQEKTAKEQEIQKICEKLKEEAEKEKKHCQELQQKGKKEAEKKHQLLEEQRQYFQQLQEEGNKLAEKEQEMQMYRQQLQDKEREEAKTRQYYNHELQKMKKELEDKKNEIQRLSQLLENKSKELIQRNQKMKEHLQQIQQSEHLKDTNVQQEETRVVQDKVQEVKLLHSSEEVEQTSESMISSKDRKLREDLKLTQKEDSKDELKGVHVAAKNSFLIHGESTQSVNWDKYGVRITIPQGAVLPSDTVQITITALVGGDFIFPEDTELVSAVYAINLSKPFIEPVKLEIQHCVSIETSSHCNYLSFSTSINNQPPYQFDTVDGGEFSIGNRYGGISIATFSKYCIKTYSGRRYQPYSIPGTSSSRARSHTLSSSLSSYFDGPCSTSSPVSPSSLHSSSSSLSFDPLNTLSTKNEVATLLTLADKPPIKCYHSQVLYEIKRQGREWLMKFFVSKNLNALIEYIKKAFRNVEKSIEVSFQFKDDDGFIELCFDGQCPKGWSVRPHQDPTRVRQIVIDEYGSMSPPRFPECLITISATPGEGAVKELSYPVTLQGIKKSNFEKMNIVLTMGDIQQASVGSIASNTGPISLDDEERKSAGEVLRENFDTLSDILAAPNNLSVIIMSLYAKKLISDTTASECMNDGRQVQDRCASLLFALKATIDGKPQAMNTLIEALKNNEAFKELAHKMDLEVSYRNYTNA